MLLGDRGVDARHHFLGHQLHRALLEPGVDPVHAGVDQLAEVADALAEGEDLVDHLVHRAADHQAVEHEVERHLGVGLVLVLLEHDVPVHLGELGLELVVVEAVRALRIGPAVGGGDLVVVGDENGARDAPFRRIRLHAGLDLAFGVVGPVRGQPLRQQEVRRQRMEIALAHRDHALRERRDHRADDLGPRLLERLGHDAGAEREIHVRARGDLEAVARQVDVVGRLALPRSSG